MSEWIRYKTKYAVADMECLAAALEATVERLRGHVELHPAGAEMFDYHRKAVTANIIVRKEHAGGWGDLGFVAQPDGFMELVADDGHRNERGGGFVNDVWLKQLTMEYAKRKVEKLAASRDMAVEKIQNPNGTWRYELTKRGTARSAVALGRLW